MSSDRRELGPTRRGRALAALALSTALLLVLGHAALVRGQAPGAPPPGGAPGAGHAGHDRTTRPASAKATDMTEHAEKSRKDLQDILDRKDPSGAPWCPTTRAEWDLVLETLACYLAVQEIWKSEVKKSPDFSKVKDEFDKRPAGGPPPPPSLGERIDTAFTGYKGVRDALTSRLEGCNKANAPPMPAVETFPGVTKPAVEGYRDILKDLRRVTKKELFGLTAVSVGPCPDCPPAAAPGTGTTPRTPTPGGTGGSGSGGRR